MNNNWLQETFPAVKRKSRHTREKSISTLKSPVLYGLTGGVRGGNQKTGRMPKTADPDFYGPPGSNPPAVSKPHRH
jgi:hypothetical protein